MVVQRGGKWLVVSKADPSEVLGEHETEAEAMEHLHAIEAAKHGRKDSVRRFDVGAELAPPVRMPNGFLRVEAYLTRTGVFDYRRADGSVIREYRPPEEVFHPDSLASFELMPVTLEHPPVGLLGPENAHQFQVGAVGHLTRADARVKGAIVVTDAKAHATLAAGRKHQISLGYTCDLDMTPGTSPEGERYDAVQRRIVGNHCAFTDVGRAGPDVRVRMDSTDAAMVLSQELTQEPEPMKRKIKLDGIEIEVDAAIADAIEQAKARTDSAVAAAKVDADKALAEVKSALDKATARADAAEAKIKTLEAEVAAAPAKALAAAKARTELETKARTILGPDAKFDGMDDVAVQRAAIAKAIGAELPKEKTAEYVAARFDAEVETAARGNPGLAAARALSTPRADSVPTDAHSKADAEFQAALKGQK